MPDGFWLPWGSKKSIRRVIETARMRAKNANVDARVKSSHRQRSAISCCVFWS
jgi:hypothetical protein